MSIGSSKMLIFSKYGMIHSFGSWEKEGDIWYSNTTYNKSHYRGGGHGWADWEGWEHWKTSFTTERCTFCDTKLTKKNKAYVGETYRFQLGLRDKEELCEDCFTMWKKDSFLEI